MRLTSTGNLLIGTTTDSGALLQLDSNDNQIASANQVFNIQNEYTVGAAYIDFDWDATTQNVAHRAFRGTNTSGTVNYQWYKGDGSSTITIQLKAKTGELKFNESGGGIDLGTGATSLDSSDENVLDHYYEGSWTPVIADAANAGNASPTSATNASYIKVGRVVTVHCQFNNIDTTGLTGTNGLYIQGFPHDFTYAGQVGNVVMNLCTGGYNQYAVMSTGNNNSHAGIWGFSDSGQRTQLLVNEITDDTSDLWITFTYICD
jgi:hypothetical protein